VDQKRFIAFLMLSMAVLMLSYVIFPPPPQKPKPKAVAAAADKQEEAPAEAAAEAPEEEAPVAAAENAKPPANVPEVPLQYLTLGSLDADSGYRMLVTLTNQGAAVQRAELTSPRFRDRQDRSGYLGNLALKQVDGGVEVGVVGAGTPAGAAGLEVGDVITGVSAARLENKGVTETRSAEDFQSVMAKTRPNWEITLQIRRGDQTKQLVAKLTRRPMDVLRPEIENIHMRGGTIPEGFIDPPSFLVSLFSVDGKPLAAGPAEAVRAWLEDGRWEVTAHDQSSVTFERAVPQYDLKIIKRFTLAPVPPASRDNENYPGYGLQLDIEIQNTGDAARSVAYRLDGPTGLPIEGWWYTHKISQRWFSAAGLRDVVVRFKGSAETQIDCMRIVEDKVEPMGQGIPLAYAGVDAVYFSSVLLPMKESLDDHWFDTTEAVRIGPKPAPSDHTPKTYSNVTVRLTREPVDLAANDSHRDSFQVFIGPKRPELLAQYQASGDPGYSLRDLLYYGMWPFGSVARAMLSILHFFYGIVGNYGIAIIMLTVLVRGAMFPISYKQTKNMARMQSLKPELDRITEKYKNDMQKRSQATQDLYRKNKINPLGGCLPLVLQFPIFIGLYRSIMVDVELRQSPLFGHWIRWCSDLAAPDMFFDWSGFMPRFVTDGIGLLGLGPYFNILPLLTVGLFLVSMKLTMPAPANDQAAMQQKMMKVMTSFMGLLFYKVASGLCLYFIASSFWGIGERKLLARNKAKEESTAAPPQRTPREAPKNGRAESDRNGSPGSKRGKKAKRQK
jgi:YidC/Oxa1 family membrane protein insertase